MKKMHIKRFSTGSMIVAVILSILFAVIAIFDGNYYQKMNEATNLYLTSEKAALRLQKGSDILTDQVRMYVITGDKAYMDGYFEEANVTKNRDHAVEELRLHFSGTQSLTDLESALGDSRMLMEREYYAMRLAAIGYGLAEDQLPDEVASVSLSAEDAALTASEKVDKGRSMVSDSIYQGIKSKIGDNVDQCIDDLLRLTQSRRDSYSMHFRVLYGIQEIGLIFLLVFLIASSLIVRTLIVNPLVSYNSRIEHDETVPLIGAAELQTLAQTYNRVFTENQATQKIIRHEAEHDALSDLLNRGSFNKILSLYNEGNLSYALLIVDIDTFKSVNDTYGHAVGDAVIQYVANKIRSAFRVTDYVFRIGGDEFAIIMLDMSTNHRSAVEEKLLALQESLKETPKGIPAVTVSVGVAFSDRQDPSGSIFQDADKMLYTVKEGGKNGFQFYE